MKRPNEGIEGKEDEKEMKISSGQSNLISEKPKVEVKEWKDYTKMSPRPKSSRPRVVWNADLHLKFTAALSALGDTKARPKSILKMMNEPHLTQRQVASHLQVSLYNYPLLIFLYIHHIQINFYAEVFLFKIG
ncbi:Myb_DNA-binding domain-containing protein [Cephalotus follicularis]|uniref:Myb_DNA-binding domain-containing protein n=1 Tax=Cephalotus follicularis TaxID=3775 RepID=A0A1Q3CTP1_CEPFO|nr:Myb_DNA-binding domain-containing protein [Cephalotus follicularis]